MSNAEPRPDDPLLQLEIEKHRLECEKLRAEIEQVRQPLWKRSGYIASLSPLIIALVAFFSAWVTGYFDTQKQVLESEVAALTERRDELAATSAALAAKNDQLEAANRRLAATNDELAGTNAALQARIDTSFLRLRIMAGEARYAFGHVRALPIEKELDAGIRQVLRADPPQVPPATGRLLDAVLQREQLLAVVVEATEEELGKLDKSVNQLPASEWAKPLAYEPTPAGTLLFTQDRRVYDLARDLFYDDIEAWRENRPSARQKE